MTDDDLATDERLGPLLEYFAERLNRVFAHYFCVFEFEDDEAMTDDPAHNARAWVLQTIQNACLHESLIALRDLDDFLTLPHSKPDDLRASDFGYPQKGSFLTKVERDSINKMVAHTTTTGAASLDHKWDIWELITKCVFQSFEFLKWVETKHLGFQLWSAAIVCRTKTQKIHDYIASEMAERRK